METIEISTVDEFHKQIEKVHHFHPIFRGEDKATYKLLSKFGRYAAFNEKNTVGMEIRTLEEFKRRSIPFLTYEPKDEWDWMALAQQHGLATRLLDWTKNPMVAAYFANNKSYIEDSVIYVFDEASIKEVNLGVSPFSITEDCLFRPKHTASRIASQAGLFTVHVNSVSEFSNPTLQRWLLKKAMLIDMMTMLNTYGFRKTFIFPGLDSICYDIHDSHIWRDKKHYPTT